MRRTPRIPGWVLVALALTLALGVAVWTTRDAETHPDALDPRNPGPEGGQALAKVLEEEGVDVTIVRSADALDDSTVDGSTTVVVTSTEYLAESTFERLRKQAAPGRLVLVEPSYPVVQDIDRDLTTVGQSDDRIAADCSASVDGLTLEVDNATVFRGASDDATCFATSGGAVLLERPDERLVLFGAGQALSNDQVLRADNAAIALRVLGASERVVWYVPDPADATADEAVTLSSLIPRWIGPGVWLGALSVIALILWRMRRLGPLSTEPLPVVVRAVETAHSRGRMYRRSGDRGHAARALRRAARADLATRLRLDRRTDATTLIDATARHLGAPVDAIGPLLTEDQPPPATDHDLIRLAQELTRLRREVRRG
ncbi:MAG: DUF4350 domain-containing protein [Propionibacteriales bacterium]|nr:DUF4350 domain-containing protein [Propionibacteriales bacterium]